MSQATSVAVRTPHEIGFQQGSQAVAHRTDAFVSRLADWWDVAQKLSRSRVVKYTNPEAVFAVMLKGHELGVPFMEALGSIYFFDGKLTIKAQLMVGIAHRNLGVQYRITEWTDKRCELEFTRAGWDPITSEFTIEEAERANLLKKDNWKHYPKDMLMARAQARGVRNIAPDLFSSTYDPDEVGVRNERELVESTEGSRELGHTLEERIRALDGQAPAAQPSPEPPGAQVVDEEAPADEGVSDELTLKVRRLMDDAARYDSIDEVEATEVETLIQAGDSGAVQGWVAELQRRILLHLDDRPEQTELV